MLRMSVVFPHPFLPTMPYRRPRFKNSLVVAQWWWWHEKMDDARGSGVDDA